MRKYTLLFLSLAFTINTYGQNYKNASYNYEIVYKMTSQPDSLDKKSEQTEYMTLLVGKDQSLFCATKYLLMDSAIAAEKQKGNAMGPSFEFLNQHGTKSQLLVFKLKDKLVSYDEIAPFIFKPYFYEEKRPLLEWKVLNDTLKIGGYTCQKAVTVFGNRKWEAWFATDLPLPEGPYKFHGLPGLILKIADSQKYWQFDVLRVAQVNKTIDINFLGKVPVSIESKAEFLKQKKYNRDNRMQLMEQRGWAFPDRQKSIKVEAERAAKDNNWIELY